MVVLRADFSPNAVALLLALFGRSAIVVPITDAAAAKQAEFTEIAQGEWAATLDANDDATFEQLPFVADYELYTSLREAGHPGLVLFSSGSTGQSKAAVHDLSRLLEKFRTKRQSLRTLAFLHFDHIGGIDTLFYGLSNGSCTIFVDDRSPIAVCRTVEKHGVEVLPVAPTFLNFLALSGVHKDFDLRSLRYVTYGAEVMPEATLKQCGRMFPGVTLLQKYGTTEVGTLRSKSKSSDSLWLKLGGEGYQTRVVDGCLQIKARAAMLGYLNAPSPFTEDGWFITGDAVEVDGEFLRILGRKSDIVNVGGEKVFPAEVEDVIGQMENIREVTVWGEPHPLAGEIVCARITLVDDEPRRSVIRRVNQFCSQHLQPYKVPFRIAIVDGDQATPRFKKARRA